MAGAMPAGPLSLHPSPEHPGVLPRLGSHGTRNVRVLGQQARRLAHTSRAVRSTPPRAKMRPALPPPARNPAAHAIIYSLAVMEIGVLSRFFTLIVYFWIGFRLALVHSIHEPVGAITQVIVVFEARQKESIIARKVAYKRKEACRSSGGPILLGLGAGTTTHTSVAMANGLGVRSGAE